MPESNEQPSLSEPTPDLHCDNCGEEYQYDPLAGYGCLVLLDQREVPHRVLGVWCNEACLNEWLDTPEAAKWLAPGL